MKNFLIILRYKVPIEIVEKHTEAHRAFLKTQYDANVLLMSGPFVPRTAGLLWGQAEEKSGIDQMILNDPFNTEGVADYEVIEFKPVMHAPLLDGLFESQQA
jgi:uncharacterized protein YciI